MNCFQWFYYASLNVWKCIISLLNAKSISKIIYLESMKFLSLSKNHFPPILFTYVGAWMLIATFVRCLSLSLQKYIGYRHLGCHSDHEQIWQNQIDTDTQSKGYNQYKGHIFSYRTFCLREVEGWGYISDIHNFQY